MCVCVLGFQGAGGSSYCHHNSHRFLLHCQLCEGGHFGDAGPRLCRHYSRGKTPHLPPDTLWVQTPLLHSLFSNKREVRAAYLEVKVTFIRCLVHKRPPQQGSQCSYDHLHSLNSVRLHEAHPKALFLDAVLCSFLCQDDTTLETMNRLWEAGPCFPSRFILTAVAVCLSVLPIGCFPNGESKFGSNVDSSLHRTRWHWFSLGFLCHLA